MKTISFVIPVYNSEKTIAEVVARIQATMHALANAYCYECVLVNDGSRDSSALVCRQLCSMHPHIRFLDLSRNFGQTNAIMAGLHATCGDYVICLDDDLQTPPEEAPKLIDAIESSGLDVVYGRCAKKQAGYRNWGSRLNARMTEIMLNKPKHLDISSYWIVRRYVVDQIVQYRNPFPYLLGLVLGITRRIGNVELRHETRRDGKSTYTLRILIRKWIDGLINFSIKPLQLSSIIGLCISTLSFVLLVAILLRKLIHPHIQLGWTSIIAVALFLGGIQLLALGLLGEYVGRIYLCINGAPQFIIKDSMSSDAGDVQILSACRSE